MDRNQEDPHRYDDMLDLPHHVSKVHPQMPMSKRAAQFSPFAALTGFEDAVRESERLTEARIELDESQKEQLGKQIQILLGRKDDGPEATVTWFQPDARKSGGAYLTRSGIVKEYDALRRLIVLEDGTQIALDDLVGIDAAIFHQADYGP